MNGRRRAQSESSKPRIKLGPWIQRSQDVADGKWGEGKGGHLEWEAQRRKRPSLFPSRSFRILPPVSEVKGSW